MLIQSNQVITNGQVRSLKEHIEDMNEVYKGMNEVNHCHVSLMLSIGDEE